MRYAPLYPVERGPDHPQIQRAVRSFLKSAERGETHSVRGLVLHHVLNHCVEHGIGFVLTFDPCLGYRVKLLKPTTP
jgi:hypothetical protein